MLRRRVQAALAELGGALPLGAVALLLLNDHVLKRTFPGALTGKLSDVAICLLTPLLVSAALGILRDWSLKLRLSVGSVIAASVFAALEMSDAAGAVFARTMAAVGIRGVVLTRDPTDLLALACVPGAVAYGWRRGQASYGWNRRWSMAAGILAMLSGSLALMATTEPRCTAWTAPLVFQVQGDCGPNGVIVVESSHSTILRIYNAQALGLAPPTSENPDEPNGVYLGSACPATLTQGEWRAYCAGIGNTCPSGDYRECIAKVEDGGLWVTCYSGTPLTHISGTPLTQVCRSQLTVVP